MVNMRNGYVLKRCIPHSGEVTSVAYAAEDHLIVSASWDRTLRVHDEVAGEAAPTLRAVVNAHSADIQKVALSYQLSLLATGGSDGSLRFWDFQVTLHTHHLLLPNSHLTLPASLPASHLWPTVLQACWSV